MNSGILNKYFQNATDGQHKELLDLFEKLEAVRNTFYGLIIEERGKYQFGYASLSIERLTGHPYANFSYDGGSPFFFSITPNDARLNILEQEAYYLIRTRRPGFDVTKPFIADFDGGLIHANGQKMNVRMVGLILEFTPDHQFHRTVNAWQVIDSLTEEELVSTRAEIQQILLRIHELYVSIFADKFSTFKSSLTDSIKLSYPFYGQPDITKREYTVLKLIASGLSSREIGEKLNISFHTAESHRRSLLEKFEAKNVAELIKKATKLYWLE